MAAAELGVFLEQALLHVEAEGLRLVVFVVGGNFAGRELVDIAVAEQNVEQRLAAIIGIGVEDLRRPHLVGGEALREFHQLPEVGARLAGRVDELPPDMGAALRVAVGAFLLDPHRRGQNEIGGHRRHGRIGVGDDDEVVRIAVARIGLAARCSAPPAGCCSPGSSRNSACRPSASGPARPRDSRAFPE